MVTRIQKWGNSQGLRIARTILESAQVDIGDEVNVSAEEGVILIRPVKPARKRHNLEDLLKRIPKNHRAAEADWGKPRGKEEW